MSAATPLEPDRRARLIEVARRVLADEGIEALSLRRVAREAGVSHGAPLRHFRSVADLRSEVAACGFQALAGAIERSERGLGPGASAGSHLAAAGDAYVRTAIENSDLFALMFRPDELDAQNPSLERHGRGSFDELVRSVEAAQRTGWQADRDTRQLAACIWASVHGLATLWSQGAMRRCLPEAGLEALLETLFDLILEPEEPR